MTNLGGNAGNGANIRARQGDDAAMDAKATSLYRFECHDKDGNLKWTEEIHNLVTTEGKNDLLTNYFKGSAYTGAFYVGLISGATPTLADTDTAAAHAAWTEFANYSETARPTWTGGTASAGSIDNGANPAAFSINGAGGTVGGAFLATNSTKSGATGKLYGEAQLTSARTLANGDTLQITIVLTV